MASKPIDVFVIASLHDSVYLRELRSQLGVLENQGLLKTWHETEIRVSKNRASEIAEKLEKAEAVIVLASSELWRDRDIREHQLLPAIELARKSEKHLLPILVQDFLWKETAFSGLQVLPKSEIPIGRAGDAAKRAKVWSEVVVEIRALLLNNGF